MPRLDLEKNTRKIGRIALILMTLTLALMWPAHQQLQVMFKKRFGRCMQKRKRACGDPQPKALAITRACSGVRLRPPLQLTMTAVWFPNIRSENGKFCDWSRIRSARCSAGHR